MTEWIFQSGLSNIIVGAIEDEKAVGAAVLSGEEKELLGGHGGDKRGSCRSKEKRAMQTVMDYNKLDKA